MGVVPDLETSDAGTSNKGSSDGGTSDEGTSEAGALSATARVILGMLSLGKRTGYDIKQLVDKSTRHFWAASYGQIYPELKRLQDQGLVGSRSEPCGRRPRTVFELTETGSRALREWLESPGEPLHELRDEGLLKLFFSDAGGPAARGTTLGAISARHERKLAELRAVAEHVEPGDSGPTLTLEFGIAFNEWIVGWCETTVRRLGADAQ